jgi:hypothetical protein
LHTLSSPLRNVLSFVFPLQQTIQRTQHNTPTDNMAKKKKTKRQLLAENRQLRQNQGIINQRTLTLRPQDVIDWLQLQYEAPAPLLTGTDTMMLWMEAMESGLSTPKLQRRVGEMMELWRQQGSRKGPITRDKQEQAISDLGADLDAPIVSLPWQKFLATRLNFSSISTLTLEPTAATEPVASGLITTTSRVDTERQTVATTTIVCSTTPLPPSAADRPM